MFKRSSYLEEPEEPSGNFPFQTHEHTSDGTPSLLPDQFHVTITHICLSLSELVLQEAGLST